jgi:hypothetical protein
VGGRSIRHGSKAVKKRGELIIGSCSALEHVVSFSETG